jgi:FkbM family methyltransferase
MRALRWAQTQAAQRLDVTVLRHSESNYLRPHLARVLAALRPDVVLDVGANRGQFVDEVRSIGYAGHIVSFEPTPSIFEELATRHGGDPNWVGHQFGLGARDGELTLHLYGEGSLNSLLPASDFGRDRFRSMVHPHGSIQVPIMTLDQVWEDLVPEGRAFLKIDTQGFDLEVLRGAARSMDKIVGILTEVPVNPIYEGMPSMSAVFSHLEGLEFQLTGLFPVTRDRSRVRLVEGNCVFVRSSALS